MSDLTKEWLKELYSNEIEETKGSISNERLWEKGYGFPDENGWNPHTDNIKTLEEYIEVLEGLIKDLE